MLEDIIRGQWRGGADGGKLTELCKLLPEESEVARVRPLRAARRWRRPSSALVQLVAGEAAAVLQREPVALIRGRSLHGAAGQGAAVSKPTRNTSPFSLREKCACANRRSYEELLKTMVLRQEFSPLMEEASKSLAVMIQAANGTHASVRRG